MHDLSLHVLDLLENAIRAGATAVTVSVTDDAAGNAIGVVVEDNGPGLRVGAETAADPFYTTKPGKRTGLGLSLFRAAMEEAGGRAELGRSDLGGLRVCGVMVRDHVDRKPMGDLAATLWSVACTNPGLAVRLRVTAGGRSAEAESVAAADDPVAAADRLAEDARKALSLVPAPDGAIVWHEREMRRHG